MHTSQRPRRSRPDIHLAPHRLRTQAPGIAPLGVGMVLAPQLKAMVHLVTELISFTLLLVCSNTEAQMAGELEDPLQTAWILRCRRRHRGNILCLRQRRWEDAQSGQRLHIQRLSLPQELTCY